MGLFDGLMGNASEVSAADAEKEFAKLLAPGEKIEKAYLLIRDMFLFTNKRLILVDRQGLTGKKTEFHSILYDKVTQFSVETAGSMDLDSELKIWISGSAMPVQKTLSRKLDVYELQSVLARYVMK